MGLPPVLNIILFILMFASWCVMLGATAAYHDEVSLGDHSNHFQRIVWWPVWFEFFLLLVFVVCIATGKIDEWKGVLVAFSAMAGAYVMELSERWLTAADDDGDAGDLDDIHRALAAGYVMVVIVNWLCIILYGNDSFREMVAAKAEAVAEPVTGS